MRHTLAVLLLMPALAAAQDARVSLKPRATVAGPVVTLGAVAGIEGSADVAARLSGVTLARTPLAGQSIRIALAEVRRLVRAQTGDADIGWEGARAVDIMAATQEIDSTRIAAVAQAHVRKALEAHFERVAVEMVESIPRLTLRAGSVKLEPRALAIAHPGKREVVWIDAYVDGVFERALAVPVRVAAWSKASVARADLAAGAEPRADEFETREVDVTDLAAPPAAPTAGQRLKRTVRAGTVLLAADLEPRPAVARGEPVILTVDSPGLHIEARATALADAAIGQALWVKREAGGEPLRARVVSPGNVEVASR